MSESRGRGWFKEFLEWAHHAYWIREFLISSGIAAGVMRWVVTHYPYLAGYRWPAGLFIAGGMMYLLDALRRRKAKRSSNEEDLIIPQSKVEQVLGPIFEDVKGAGGQATMLWLFAAWAKDLIQRLEEAGDHWHYAGENLIHPLDATLDKIDYMKDKSQQLLNDRRDFAVEYIAHLRRIAVDLPGFSSEITTMAYPTDTEFRRVLNGLRVHSEKLDEEADKIWKSETPDSSLTKAKST